MDLLERSRRLRGTPILRELVRETRCSKSSLIYPMFVKRRNQYQRRNSFHAGAISLFS